jgi:hypothetical protein
MNDMETLSASEVTALKAECDAARAFVERLKLDISGLKGTIAENYDAHTNAMDAWRAERTRLRAALELTRDALSDMDLQTGYSVAWDAANAALAATPPASHQTGCYALPYPEGRGGPCSCRFNATPASVGTMKCLICGIDEPHSLESLRAKLRETERDIQGATERADGGMIRALDSWAELYEAAIEAHIKPPAPSNAMGVTPHVGYTREQLMALGRGLKREEFGPRCGCGHWRHDHEADGHCCATCLCTVFAPSLPEPSDEDAAFFAKALAKLATPRVKGSVRALVVAAWDAGWIARADMEHFTDMDTMRNRDVAELLGPGAARMT